MAEQINERIGTGDTPTLLGGDFNARTDSNVICEVMKNWQRICDDTFTYPADQPTIKIDYIFGLPQNKWKVKSFKVLSNPEVYDHRAFFAEVEFVKCMKYEIKLSISAIYMCHLLYVRFV